MLKLTRTVWTIWWLMFKSLTVLSVTTGGISIESFPTAIGAPVGMANASFSLAFSISTGIVKNC